MSIPGGQWRALALLPVLAISAPVVATAHAATTKTVTLKDISFKPAKVTIASGDSVRFVWKDGNVQHNVTSNGKLRFRTSSTRKTGSYTVKLTKRGTYRFSCTLHFGMDGSITVR
jgi:plastocyanin